MANNISSESEVTGWVGWVYFAAFMLILNGLFQSMMGLIALFDDQYYAIVNSTLVVFDITTWGWVHLLLGIILVVAGAALFSGKLWARIVAIILAILSVLSQLMFISAYPIWSIFAIVIDFVVIYALTVHGSEARIDEDI